MNKIYLFFFLLPLFFSCTDKTHFKVNGHFADGNETVSMVYLKKVDLNSETIIDSAKISHSGKFVFKVKRPACPDFYRLSFANHDILFSVDSTETIGVDIRKHEDEFLCEISGSENSRLIQELRLSLLDIENQFKSIYTDSIVKTDFLFNQRYEQLSSALSNHKKKAEQLIFSNPRSAVSYYALFQEFHHIPVFDPFDEKDLLCYAAVATSLNIYCPHSERSKHLSNLVLQVRKSKRVHALKSLFADSATGLIDIHLPNEKGKEVLLSGLKGKVVLLSFCYYETKHAEAYLDTLLGFYKKYVTQGFQIYSVSFDENFQFWRLVSRQLPWITVHDSDTLSSHLFALYNITDLPLFFLINKQGDIVSRHTQLDSDFEKQVLTLLKE
jgi:peroxiredoxin